MAGLTEAQGSSLLLDNILASTANGEGASRVSIEDAGGNFTGTTVEAALAELVSSHFLSTVLPKATNYTVVAGNRNAFFPVTGTSLISLLPAATAGTGFALMVQNSGVGVVTVDGDGAETINGVASIVLAAGDWIILTCDGANWVGAIYVVPAGSSDLSVYAKKSIDRFLQSYGDSSDGAFSSIGASTISDFLYNHTTFALNSGHTITIDVPVCIIRATTSITIDGDINARGADIAGGAGALLGRLGDSLGSSGGGGGSGGLGYDAVAGGIQQIKANDGEAGASTYFAAGGAGGASSGGNGSTGSVPAANQKVLITSLFSTLIARGGGAGGRGSKGGYGLQVGHGIDYPSAPGEGGLAGCLLILMAPSITINAVSTLDLTGQAGTNAAAYSATSGGSGGGGGGAGGSLIKVSPAITDAGTTTVTGGAGGSGAVGGFGGDGGDGGAGANGYTYTIDPTA